MRNSLSEQREWITEMYEMDKSEAELKPKVMNKYRCKHCGIIVKRDSEKAWIKSWCDATQKNVHLIKTNSDEMSEM